MRFLYFLNEDTSCCFGIFNFVYYLFKILEGGTTMILLQKENFGKLFDPIKTVKINNLFARAIIEGRVEGKIFVDNEVDPQSFYVLHPYGMSLLFGDFTNAAFNSEFRNYMLNTSRQRQKDEWMQVFPDGWNAVIESFGLIPPTDSKSDTKIEVERRVNFKFDKDIYLSNKEKYTVSDPLIKVIPTDKAIYEQMKGAVIPSCFWDSGERFVKEGFGFSAFYGDELASTAFSAFVIDDKLELGIETREQFRGKRTAYSACCGLIDYCLTNGFEPVWACRMGNVGSYKLAEKLGFVKSLDVPYYKLCV